MPRLVKTKEDSLKYYGGLFFALVGIFLMDHYIKEWILLSALDKYALQDTTQLFGKFWPLYETKIMNLDLIFNKGVAFSMFAFLEEWLKWIQLLLISGVMVYIVMLRDLCFAIPGGILLGAGFSNVFDRFQHGGVVDYFHYHYGFNFAIFNFADVMIDFAVAWIIILNIWPHLCATKES